MTGSTPIDSIRNANGQSKVIRFGAFELEPLTGRLSERGAPIPLPEQAFVVLNRLLEHAGQPVSRQALKELLWPDEVAGDFDNKLNRVLSKIRAALHDDAEHPRFIETLPRRGYRFVGRIERVERKPQRVRWTRQTRLALGAVTLLTAVIGVSVAAAVAMGGRSAAPVPQLAVLPFISQSGDENTAALAQGLTFELTHHLARIDPNSLIVLAPKTASRLAPSDTTRTLDFRADYVLDGFIQQSIDSVHILLRLHRAASNEILLTRSYDRSVAQTFGLRREIAEDVAKELRVALVADPHAIRDIPAAALDAFWRARFLWASDDPEQIKQSLPLFERAISIAPEFAEAHSGMADSYNALALRGALLPREGFEKARVAARAAIAADDNLASGHVALALSLYLGDWAWDEAESEIERALFLSPGRAEPYSYLASLRSIQGDHTGAIDASRRAVQFNPLTSAVTADLAWYYYYGGRYVEALEQIHATEPQNIHANGLDLATTLVLLEMGNDSLAARSLREMVNAFHGQETAAHIDSLSRIDGTREAWRWWLGRVLEAARQQPPRVSYIHAIGATVLADTGTALASLERAVEARVPWAPFIGVDPAFAPLRQHPKFQELLNRMGLSQHDLG